jgi:MIP family channel proteins
VNLSTLRPVLAEFVGTFLFVLVGTASVVANAGTNSGLGIVGVAAAHGVALAIIVTATMNISGGHLNPAVTAGMWLVRRIDAKTAGLYVAAQLLGAVIASLTVKGVLPFGAVNATSGGTPQLSSHIGWPQAFVLEALFTFLLVSAIFGTAVSAEAPKVGGFGIGLAVFVSALAIGPYTGAALNPARAFGPALVFKEWHTQGWYWIGPLTGALLAALLWDKVLLRPKTDPVTPRL